MIEALLSSVGFTYVLNFESSLKKKKIEMEPAEFDTKLTSNNKQLNYKRHLLCKTSLMVMNGQGGHQYSLMYW